MKNASHPEAKPVTSMGKGRNGPMDRNNGTKHYTPVLPKPNAPRAGATKK